MEKSHERLKFLIEREHQRISKIYPSELDLLKVQAISLVWLPQLVEAFENKIQNIEKGGDSKKVMECFSDLVRLKDCIYLIKDIEIPFDKLEDLTNLETHSDEIPLLKNENFTSLNNSPDIDNDSLDEFLTEREDLIDLETSSYTYENIQDYKENNNFETGFPDFQDYHDSLFGYEYSPKNDETHPEINDELSENINNSTEYSTFNLKLIKASCLTLLLILEEAHSNQADNTKKRGDMEQAKQWYADSQRFRDVINLVTTIQIPFENDENLRFCENEYLNITKTSLDLIIDKEMEEIAILYKDLDVSLVQERCLNWLSLFEEAHEDQANDAEKRGDAEQAMGWFADSMRLRDVISLVENIDIPFANSSNSIDENQELRYIYEKYGTKINISKIFQKKIYRKDKAIKPNHFQKRLELTIKQEGEKILGILPNDQELASVQARSLCWLALFAEAHEDQASDAKKRGDAEQAMGWFADSMRLRDVINLITSIEIDLFDNKQSLDEKYELLDVVTKNEFEDLCTKNNIDINKLFKENYYKKKKRDFNKTFYS